MRSASRIRITLAGVSTLPLAALLAGCVTTQQVAARARLVDARIRASQDLLRITGRNGNVQVTRLSVVHAKHGTAIVAELRNLSTRPLTDLPVLVGIRTRGGHRTPLNRAANTDYLDSHIVSMPAGKTVTWVFTSHRRLVVAGAPFVEVGTAELPEPPVRDLPQIEVKPATPSPAATPTLSLSITNLSGVPQYSLPVYAIATRHGRVSGAGRATVAHLGTHGIGHMRLALLGSQKNAVVQLSAIPTIFQ